MMNPTHPDAARLSLFLWLGFERLPIYIETEICQKYLLTLFFLKAVSAIWQEDVDAIATMTPIGELGELSNVASKSVRFLVPPDARFDLLLAQHHEAGNIGRVAKALRSLGEANRDKLGTLFDELQFQAVPADSLNACNTALGFLLAHVGQAKCDLRPSQLHNSPDQVLGRVFTSLLYAFGALHRASCAVFSPPPPAQQRLITPRPIAQLMARLVKPMPGEAIFDPACGTAGLLMACVEQIRHTHASDDCLLFGQELVGERCALSRMHLLLHGMDSHRLKHGDAIADSLLLDLDNDNDNDNDKTQFDVVLMAPPAFIMEPNPHLTHAGRGSADSTSHNTCPGLAFSMQMLACLRPQTGRMAVLLPIAALSRGGKDREIRAQLVNANAIDSVICLPRNLHPGYPHNAMALLLLRREAAYAPVFFMDTRAAVSGDDADTDAIFACIADTVLRKRDVDELSRLVSTREITQAGFNLAAPFLDMAPEDQAA